MRRNLDISMWILIALLAFTSIRTGAFSDPMGWLMDKLLLLPGIVLGLSMHEYAHAKVAYKLGDPTPKMQGTRYGKSYGAHRSSGDLRR